MFNTTLILWPTEFINAQMLYVPKHACNMCLLPHLKKKTCSCQQLWCLKGPKKTPSVHEALKQMFNWALSKGVKVYLNPRAKNNSIAA